MKKVINWNSAKNEILKKDKARGGVCFEDCVSLIEDGYILMQFPHPSRENQNIFVLNIKDYTYCVPYIENDTEIFLKTIFPARKFKYLIT
ncbi:toxin [Candidatus Gracilibacteria bacterium]|nr:toxin [Candidatus Gracilibacteria bacterium]